MFTNSKKKLLNSQATVTEHGQNTEHVSSFKYLGFVVRHNFFSISNPTACEKAETGVLLLKHASSGRLLLSNLLYVFLGYDLLVHVLFVFFSCILLTFIVIVILTTSFPEVPQISWKVCVFHTTVTIY